MAQKLFWPGLYFRGIEIQLFIFVNIYFRRRLLLPQPSPQSQCSSDCQHSGGKSKTLFLPHLFPENGFRLQPKSSLSVINIIFHTWFIINGQTVVQTITIAVSLCLSSCIACNFFAGLLPLLSLS